MVHKGHHFILAFEGAICLGFYQHDYLDDQVTRLHKYTYFLKRKEGAGRLLIDAVVAYAKENHSKTLSLNVNRFNKAVSFMKTRF
jgi:hypothetical protein